MTAIRKPQAIQREGGQRLYIDTRTQFVAEMRRANDWAIMNLALGKHSELKKPYLADSYQGMENYSAQDYFYDSNMSVFDWEPCVRDPLITERIKRGGLEYTYRVTFTFSPDYIQAGTGTFLIDISPFNPDATWQWTVTTSNRDVKVTNIVPVRGDRGKHVVEVYYSVGSGVTS